MSILKVLNVGQGDSIVLSAPKGCKFDDKTVFVDLGPGQYNTTEQIKKTGKVHIFITHHDADHFNGMRFFVDKINMVEEITVPFYQNEITLIAKSILNLKGIRSAQDCGEFIRLLDDIVSNQVYLKEIISNSGSGPRLTFAHEHSKICNHVTCLNPPMIMDTFNWLKETSIDELSKIMDDIFESSFARDINSYMISMSSGSYISNSTEINNITLDNKEKYYAWQEDETQGNIYTLKGSYVINFIMKNLHLIKTFNSNPVRNTLQIIYENYVKCAHDACIVLKAEYNNRTFLLTGDASKKVFYRLIREGKDISANYLKLPHHGSKHNMNEDILDAINPDVAIISHNNRCFGKSVDSHPNMEILEMLESKNKKIMLTNDVYKHDILCIEKTNHSGDQFVEML